MEGALRKIPFFVKKGTQEWFNYVKNIPKNDCDTVDLIGVFIGQHDYHTATELLIMFGNTPYLRSMTTEKALEMGDTEWPSRFRRENPDDWFFEILFYVKKNNVEDLDRLFEWCSRYLSEKGVQLFVEEVFYLGMAYVKENTMNWALFKLAAVKFCPERQINTFYLASSKFPALLPRLMELGLTPANFDVYQFVTVDNFEMAQRVINAGYYEPDNMEQLVEGHEPRHVSFLLRNNFDESRAFRRALLGKKMNFLNIFFAANARPIEGVPVPNCDAAREWKNRAREARQTAEKERGKFVKVSKEIVTVIDNPEHRFSSRRVKNVEQQIASFIVEKLKDGDENLALKAFFFGRKYKGYFFDWWLPNCSLGQTAGMFCQFPRKTEKLVRLSIKFGSNYFINSKE